MYKFIILSLCVVFASAGFFVGNNTNSSDLAELLQGFNDALNIDSDQDFDKCADVPIITDVEKTIHDLNTSKPDPFALIADVTSLFGDFTQLKGSCPEVYADYEKYFSNFTAALKANYTVVLKTLYTNVMDNFDMVQAEIASFTDDVRDKNYYNVGGDFGKIVGIAFEGYIAN